MSLMSSFFTALMAPILRADILQLCGKLLYFCVFIAMVNQPAGAESARASNVVAAPYSIEGSVSFRRQGEASWSDLHIGATFRIGDTVRTGEDGSVAFKFVDGTLVRLGRTSAITFSDVTPKGSPVLSQAHGKAYIFSRGAKNEPEIKTRMVNAAIYGTELVIDVSEKETSIDVLHGVVRASNSKNNLNLNAGERVLAGGDSSLKRSTLVQPSNSVQWMVRFPFLLVQGDLFMSDDAECSLECRASIERALDRVSKGETLLAALSTENLSFHSSQRGKLLSAIALWQVGDLTAARQAIASVGNASSPTSIALREVLLGFDALFSGNNEAARNHLRGAQAARDNMINIKLLSSYIYQAQGEIDRALTVAHDARVAHPQEADLLDREAELLMSSDQTKDALKLIEKRLRSFGKSVMNSTLAGFAALERKEYGAAEVFFKDAIANDVANGLPYLGLALLNAKDRNYEGAKELLSKAVQLEPANATYRSYLGKLFFEDSDTPKSLEEFDAAIALDPYDPSPYLYRSYAKVANNEPIQALADIEKSIDLNDGRAVYRSRLLIDRDLAVRSAGLSRVFTEIGFNEVARVEAIKSITDDYSNFSAHRLLADSYVSIIDAESNFSEKRIADLMAPLSFNLFNSVGESASLGDYNALFDKKETRKALRVDYNSNRDQVGGEFIATGKSDDYGYLMSYQPYYMSGSRHRAFSGANTLRGALQWEPSPDDRIILDNSLTMIDSNDPGQADMSQDVKYGYARLGYNRRISSSLRWLTQGEYGRDRDNFGSLDLRDVTIGFADSDDVLNSEVIARTSSRTRIARTSLASQVIYNSPYLDSVSGIEGGYIDSSRREYSPVYGLSDYPDTSIGGALQSSSGGSLLSGEAYEYLSFKLPHTANLTLGVSGTSVERDLSEIPPFKDGGDLKTAISPKAGLVVTPNKWLTTRLAYFESLNSKAVLEDLSSLEPTLVGGLNQRFNDLSGAYSRNIGLGVDLKESNAFYLGAQYLRRNVTDSFGVVDDRAIFSGYSIESLSPSSSGFSDYHSESDILRGYIYSVLSPKSVLTAETLGQWLDNTDPDSGNSIITNRHRFGYKYFLGKHLSIGLQATYRQQSITYDNDPAGFWLFDTGLSYRFAEQRGRIFARVDNLLDRDFSYDQSVGLEPQLLQGRSIVFGIAYNFW